jgi:thiol-disulfide isomerase/thioredoxin
LSEETSLKPASSLSEVATGAADASGVKVGELKSEEAKAGEPPVATESKPVKEAPITITLSAGEAKSPFAPRYSPPGKGLKLAPYETPAELGVDGLQAEVSLGAPAEKLTPVKLLVTRAAPEAAYSRLYIDVDSNGKFDEPALEAQISESRGLVWSNFETALTATYVAEKTATEAYPVAFWLTVPALNERPDVIRVSRRGFKSGEVSIGDVKCVVVLSDSNNDAVFGVGDWWELRSASEPEKGSMRKIGDFAWLGKRAFQLEIADPMGNSAKLIPYDPGMTPEEDAIKRDPLAADRMAARAEKPLEFRHDIEAAMAEAVEKKRPCFIKFETTWCGPCKMMTQYVFVAKDVVDAANGVMCVMVDGDEHGELVERFKVKGYPTGVMLSAEGEEVGRFLGYQNVVAMTQFLKDNRS